MWWHSSIDTVRCCEYVLCITLMISTAVTRSVYCQVSYSVTTSKVHRAFSYDVLLGNGSVLIFQLFDIPFQCVRTVSHGTCVLRCGIVTTTPPTRATFAHYAAQWAGPMQWPIWYAILPSATWLSFDQWRRRILVCHVTNACLRWQAQLSQLTGSHDQLTVHCDRQRAQPDLSADDQVLLTARGQSCDTVYHVHLKYLTAAEIIKRIKENLCCAGNVLLCFSISTRSLYAWIAVRPCLSLIREQKAVETARITVRLQVAHITCNLWTSSKIKKWRLRGSIMLKQEMRYNF